MPLWNEVDIFVKGVVWVKVVTKDVPHYTDMIECLSELSLHAGDLLFSTTAEIKRYYTLIRI